MAEHRERDFLLVHRLDEDQRFGVLEHASNVQHVLGIDILAGLAALRELGEKVFQRVPELAHLPRAEDGESCSFHNRHKRVFFGPLFYHTDCQPIAPII